MSEAQQQQQQQQQAETEVGAQAPEPIETPAEQNQPASESGDTAPGEPEIDESADTEAEKPETEATQAEEVEGAPDPQISAATELLIGLGVGEEELRGKDLVALEGFLLEKVQTDLDNEPLQTAAKEYFLGRLEAAGMEEYGDFLKEKSAVELGVILQGDLVAVREMLDWAKENELLDEATGDALSEEQITEISQDEEKMGQIQKMIVALPAEVLRSLRIAHEGSSMGRLLDTILGNPAFGAGGEAGTWAQNPEGEDIKIIGFEKFKEYLSDGKKFAASFEKALEDREFTAIFKLDEANKKLLEQAKGDGNERKQALAKLMDNFVSELFRKDKDSLASAWGTAREVLGKELEANKDQVLGQEVAQYFYAVYMGKESFIRYIN